MPKDLKIIFWGTPDFAVPSLKTLLETDFHVTALVTAPDQPVGKNQRLTSSPVKELALQNKLLILEPTTLKDDNFYNQLLTLKPDLCVVVAYGKIIPEKYLSVPQYGFVNIHPSLLPKYRGPSPIQTAIVNGDQETGVSIMFIDKEIDHGPILQETSYKIQETSYYKDVSKDLAELGANLLVETIPQYIGGKIELKEQDHSQATFTKMLTREDGNIDWSWPAGRIHDQIRALNPEPGTWTKWSGKVFNILKAHPLEDLSDKSSEGTVIEINGQIAVQTGSHPLVLEVVQLEGAKTMPITDFLNGRPDFVGSVLK